MTVKDLKKILENVPEEWSCSFEYMPRPHEYVKENILGVRLSTTEITFISENCGRENFRV